ncbi:XrtA/PEP-CTERM system-associated ATPase [Candidatus Thiodictyon syntrophicum]|jgi:putative secretion ATPase (PEP-CTERM system associated)|uniref:ATPase n=1 Tax=Candidatus Thiodictyon syntrophicum TaxID=1166950 RepID=A0A2K8UCQ7_9GAMM|nr:XrtA/PEP-CTERM system-associated ATPase [Candidatus Thiodictyon syntrophicum]AUB83209.1 ATPase [Candidatus Thiodictyon syntrophicum]
MYDEFYGLSGKPFQLTPDHRFFFDSQGHHRALAYLRYGLEQGEGFIVITGGIGTGKTILVRALFSELEGRNIMAAQLVTTQVEPEDMLRMVCASFGLAHEGMNKATLLHNLEVIARTRFAEGRRILLVVDEAQNLPPRSLEELRMLANFQVDGRSLFQSFLLGQEELRRTLQLPNMEQLRQRIIAAYHLDPLSLEETSAYIAFRLNRVGWSGDPQFAPEVFELVHARTGGVPRRINTLCDRLMLFGCIEERHQLTREDVRVVAAELEQESGRPAGGEVGAAVAESGTAAATDPGGGGLTPGGLGERLSSLEAEVSRLRLIVMQERKLLRKAVLLQLELDAYDDLD